ncbi:fibronectin type III domain-containing protein [Natrinema sp. DC36]|uniref:fibronectin type III domain-containing protein n=1 Tax=Natrinema sp. DC36 TaxID=2878680 RepID=UPI001CF00ADB|nr:fibronectin type III domain-containing protein [Natrinema sp. DC36]
MSSFTWGGSQPATWGGSQSATWGASQPTAPTNVSVTVDGIRTITVEWEFTSNADSAIVERSPSGDGNWSEVGTVSYPTSTFTDDEQSKLDDERYDYRVIANNSIGSSDPSASVSSGRLPLPAPTGITVDAVTTDSVDLSWTDNANNEDGYRAFLSRSQQSFEGGFGNWTSGAWVRSTTQAFEGAEAAYADGSGGTPLNSPSITIPSGQMAVNEYVYLSGSMDTSVNQHIVSYYDPGNGWGGPHVSQRNGELMYYDGSWNSTGYSFPLGEWIRVGAYIDIANQWFSIMIVDSAGLHQPISGEAFIDRASFTAGDSRVMRHSNSAEHYLDAVTQYTTSPSTVAANSTTATVSSLLNGERYHSVVAGYTANTGVLDN